MADEVAQPTAAVAAMQKRWELMETLRGGTPAMRAASRKYLPQEPGESDAAFASRIGRSFLFNAYSDTVTHIAGRPFTRRVRLGESSPAVMEAWQDDVDLEGTTLTNFARAALEDAIDHGVTHALVDFPETGGKLSAAAERTMGLRPFFVHIPANAILGWRTSRFRGRDILTQLRYREDACVPDGEFGDRVAQRVRVFDRALPGERRTEGDRRKPNDEGATTWRLFELNAKSEWVLVNEGVVSINEIPLRTLYTNRCGFMLGAPALEDLAWKNLEHWQSSSDQRHILHVARVPILFGSGIGQQDLVDEEGKPIELGPNRLLTATDAQASLRFVEHGGKAIDAGRTDLVDLLDQMAALGMAPMVERGGDATATEKSIEQSESVSDLKSWVRNLEGWLAALFDLGAAWVGSEPGAAVDVYDDFAVTLRGGSDLADLQAARDARDLSRPQYLRELVRRGALAESFDAEANDAELAAEPQPKPTPILDPNAMQ